MYFSMWERSMDEALEKLVRQSGTLTWVGKSTSGMVQPSMEHLSCYLPGNLALGIEYGRLSRQKAAHYLEVAEGLAEACYVMYNSSKTGS